MLIALIHPNIIYLSISPKIEKKRVTEEPISEICDIKPKIHKISHNTPNINNLTLIYCISTRETNNGPKIYI